MNPLLAAYRYTSNNWAQIEASRMCGCCHCTQIFPTLEVVACTGLDVAHMDDPKAIGEQTAICPRCGTEALIGDAAGYPITPEFLTRMNEAWFQKTLIRKPPTKG